MHADYELFNVFNMEAVLMVDTFNFFDLIYSYSKYYTEKYSYSIPKCYTDRKYSILRCAFKNLSNS